MKRIIAATWLLVIAFFSVSCDEQNDESTTIIPRVEATMERSFNYIESAEQEKAVYSLSLREMVLSSDEDKLQINFAPSRPAGNDALVFSIKQSELFNGFIGTYPIRSLSNNKRGRADITYYHYYNKTSKSALFSSGNRMEGQIEIKAYDSTTGLASGSFEVTISNVTDPTSYEDNPAKPRKCNITLRGNFNNLKLINA
ncbi:hypothetical protein K3G39_15980 [Pontibacter sp. HSC-14F20]|uniref:hypothetical protein n=1 Tax=Pontibacter sp. HSC-14F20 TaxID=2864136 RepID=UPI001C7327C4|nr:hypothetical protein [Pontibacter sp. HSC-14F20]MBX0334740.1 hypothetical protein [Pontibacter sp. HSC-14F20]